MTRRERLEAKLEKREEWAGKAAARSEVHLATATRISDGIPFGQPILVGHHSERHARRDQEQIYSNMHKGVEEAKLADHHTAKASGLAHALESSVFSDDTDAIQALEARIAEREAERAKRKAANKAFKAHPEGTPAVDRFKALIASGLLTDDEAVKIARTVALCHYKVPFPPYSLTNLGASIRGDKKRIEEVKRRQARAAEAEAAGGTAFKQVGDYTIVTFAEKPAREVLEALRAAGFSWGGGSWSGRTEALPACLKPAQTGPDLPPPSDPH